MGLAGCRAGLYVRDSSSGLRPGRLAVGLRTASPSLAQVERAIEAGEIVATWPMRGTIHFVSARDAAWMLRLMTPRVRVASRTRLRQLELDDGAVAAAGELLGKILGGGNRLSRPQIMQAFSAAGIDPAGQRGYHLLSHWAQEGLICLGPKAGKQQTFVLLAEWVPNSRELSPAEALTELVARYFIGHGPATVHDCAKWSGLTLTAVRSGVEAARDRLTSETFEDSEYWFSEDHAEAPAHVPLGVQLLPGFDEYLLGYKERSAVLSPEHATEIVPGGNGVFRPMVVNEGCIVGTWKRAFKKETVDIGVRFFAEPKPPEATLAAAAQSYCDFVGMPLNSVTVA